MKHSLFIYSLVEKVDNLGDSSTCHYLNVKWLLPMQSLVKSDVHNLTKKLFLIDPCLSLQLHINKPIFNIVYFIFSLPFLLGSCPIFLLALYLPHPPSKDFRASKILKAIG